MPLSKRPKKNKKSQWEPWDLWNPKCKVSASFVEKFLTCRTQCRMHYIQGIRQKVFDSTYMDFGTIFHHVLEMTFAREMQSPPTKKRIKNWLNKFDKKHTPQVAKHNLKSWLLNLRLVEKVLPTYFDVYRKDFNLKWESTESEFILQHEYPDGRTANLTGLIDAVVRRGNKAYIMDHKTSSQIDIPYLQDSFRYHFQLNLYVYNFYRQFKELPGGACLNYIRRPGLRQGKQETDADFCKRIGQDVQLRPDHYFKRTYFKTTRKSIDLWVAEQLNPIMEDIRLWYENKLPVYVDPRSLKTYNRRCDLFGYLTTNQTTGLEFKLEQPPW